MKKLTTIFITILLLISAPIWGQGTPPELNKVYLVNNDPGSFYSLSVNDKDYFAVTIKMGNHPDSVSFTHFNNGYLNWDSTIVDNASTTVNNLSNSSVINQFIFTVHDTIFQYVEDNAYSGHLVKSVKAPSLYGGPLTIYRNNGDYYVCDVDYYNRHSKVMVYNTNLELYTSFEVNKNISYADIDNDGNIYITSHSQTGGIYTNAFVDLLKYNIAGQELWSKHFPDNLSGRVKVMESEDIVYYAGSNPATLCFEIKAFSCSGEEKWQTEWHNDAYPSSTITMYTLKDVAIMPFGCILVGSTTKAGQSNINPNEVVPTAIGISSSGENIWSYRENCNGLYFHAKWDKDQYLILSGQINGLGTSGMVIMKYKIPDITNWVEDNEKPENFSLSQNYPNPFNPSTTINFTIPVLGNVTIKVYDVLGKEVTTLVDEELNSGTYQKQWNASGLSSGIYFYQLRTNEFVKTNKMMVLK